MYIHTYSTHDSVEKYYKTRSQLDGKINIFSVKSTFLLKKLLKSWFHEIVERDRNLQVHTVEIAEIYSLTFLAKISWKRRFY